MLFTFFGLQFLGEICLKQLGTTYCKIAVFWMTFRFLSATKSQLAEHIPSWHPSVTGELNPKSEIPLDHASGWQYTPCTSGFETFHHGWFYEFFFEPKTRCWQLTYFWSFHPESLGKMNQPNLTVAYFSHGVNRNHQPVGASYWAMSSVWIAAVFSKQRSDFPIEILRGLKPQIQEPTVEIQRGCPAAISKLQTSIFW